MNQEIKQRKTILHFFGRFVLNQFHTNNPPPPLKKKKQQQQLNFRTFQNFDFLFFFSVIPQDIYEDFLGFFAKNLSADFNVTTVKYIR